MAQSQGIVQTDSMNNSHGKHVHNRSRFADSLSYRNAFTARFGEYTPSFVMEGVPNDRISVNTMDLIDSMSLKAPFKGTIRKIKESFAVPNMALLPRNWDKIYVQPSNGDDVPQDANCVLQNFPQMMAKYWENIFKAVGDGCDAIDTTSETLLQDCTDVLNGIMKCLILGEYIYSNGALLNLCGYKASAQWHYKKQGINTGDVDNAYNGCSYDRWFDMVISLIFSRIKEFNLVEPVGDSFVVHHIRSLSTTGEGGSQDVFYSSFRFFLEKMRENPACHITQVSLTADVTTSAFAGVIKGLTGEGGYGLFESSAVVFFLPSSAGPSSEDFTDMSQTNLNLSRILAYQLVCAHYYTNSSIDVIYTAELYRQYIHYFFRMQYSNPANAVERSFICNGIQLPYDYLSEHLLARSLYMKVSAVDYFSTASVSAPSLAALVDSEDSNYSLTMARLCCFAAIFGFRHSLRFGDYFVGSRPRPLAPINTDVSVNDGKVSVIDVTRNQWAQKFANAVMRSRQKIENYVGDLFGKTPAPDYHNPFFLTREVDTIFGDEVQNTGAAQQANENSRTANFASNAGRYTFTFENDDAHPCIYLQIISFDVKRAYTRSIDRQFLHLDRYDMFNPDFQYIGDQAVYGCELGYYRGYEMPRIFGYQSRDMEYKQRFDVASGGFVENLPGWLLTDRFREMYQPAELNPDFIRSFSVELDQFYLKMTGYSIGNYFHFAIITNNNVDAMRPMAVDPQILG